MSALTKQLQIARSMPLPLSNFEDHLFEWRNEIEFLEREKDFFLYLLKNNCDYSHIKGSAKIKVMAQQMEKFTKQKIEPFKKKLNFHADRMNEGAEDLSNMAKMHHIMSKQFKSIKKSFRTIKETTFENAEDLIPITIF